MLSRYSLDTALGQALGQADTERYPVLVSKQAELVAGSDNSWSVELNVRLRPGGRVERHDSLVHGMRYGSQEEALSEASVSGFLGRLKELFVPDASGMTVEAQRNRHRRASMP